MIGETALELLLELKRSTEVIPPFNENGIRRVIDEMRNLFDQNIKDMAFATSGKTDLLRSVQLRHTVLERNQRCLLSYIYNRLEKIRDLRWEFGSALPVDVMNNLSESEMEWFQRYNRNLVAYMREASKDSTFLDLTQESKPPKSFYIEVRCLSDFGEFETDDGMTVMLIKNTQHFLPREKQIEMPELPCWYYDKKDLKNTPSFQNGIEPETEARYRREGARFIISTGTKMGLRYDTMATGVVYFHRFYMFHSFKDFPRYVTACCCLFLAGKVEETPKKCKDIIKTARSLLTDHQYLQFGEDPREEVMTLEKILLQTIKFDLQVEHPYNFLLKYAKRLKGDKQKLHKMVQMAWTFVNDSLCTTLSLQWESEIIAIALMYLAGKLSKFEVVDWHGRLPKHARWWDMFVEDISMELLEDICHQVLDLYSNTPTGTTSGTTKPESPPTTPPSHVPIARSAATTPTQQVKPINTPPAQVLAAIPVQVGKIKPEPLEHLKLEIKQAAPQTKKIRLNPQPVVTPIEAIIPQPPLPTPSVPPPQPPPYAFTPTPDNYAQYATPSPVAPGFQGLQSYQGYPPAEPMQQSFEGDPRYNQGHYQGGYDNAGYQNYQQTSGQGYYNVPPPPAPYPGQGYQDAYTNDYPPSGGAPPPNAAYPPQAPGYPPPPNHNYPVAGPYPPRGGPPMGQHASPNPNVAPVRITGPTKMIQHISQLMNKHLGLHQLQKHSKMPVPELPCWYYDKKDLKNTPSFQNGIDPETEARYRQEGARFIISTGTQLGLRNDTMATGVVYFHRFYMFHSFKDFPRYVTACCCLFLAGKVEETPKKCKDIIKTARSLLTDQQYLQFGDDPRSEVMTMEKILLQTIKFDLQVEHPYIYLLKYAKKLKGDKQKLTKMVQVAWTFVNDSLCTTLSLQWESEIIAIALMHLAGKLSKFEVEDWHGRTPKHTKWWDMFVEDISMDLLEDICHQVLDLYSSTPGGIGAAAKAETPPSTPPNQIPVTRSSLPLPIQGKPPNFVPNPFISLPWSAYPRTPPPPHTVIPVQIGKITQQTKSELKQLGPQGNKKIRLNPETVLTSSDVMNAQPPLPPSGTPVLPPQSFTFTPTAAETYAQYATPPPGFQGPSPSYQGYPPPDGMQQSFEAHPHYQGHYQGNYNNSGYQNYQPPYYNAPPPAAYPGPGYQEVYPNDYPPGVVAPLPTNTGYPPQAPGYPPNPNYHVPGPYPPIGQLESPRLPGRAVIAIPERKKMPELQCWYYDKKELKNTPSFQHGIDPATEARYRQEGALFIINTGTELKLQSDTKATGVVYFHRFYMFHSFKDFPRYVTACCCLFLAGKVEETPKKCRDVIKMARTQLTPNQYLEFGRDPMSEVMTLEKILLQTIKFDFEVEHPYSYLVKYAKRLKGDEQKITEMVQKAWAFINDSLCTTLSLQWESEIIAIALLHLGGEKSKFTITDWHGRTPNHTKWWDMFVENISMDLIEDICHQVLALYAPGRIGAAIKPESPPKTPPLQVARALLPPPVQPVDPLEPSHTPPPRSQPVIPAQKRKALQQLVPQENKKIKCNPPIPTEVMPPQPPLPPPIVRPPEPNSFTPPAVNSVQYFTPPPNFQAQAYQHYPPPEAMQQSFEVHPRFQGHYPGNYNPGYQNYQQQYYYNMPPPPAAYPGQGYPVYSNEYPPGMGAQMPPNMYSSGYPQNYQVRGSFPPMDQYGSPNRQHRPM
uniref:Cyclin-K n=1 Tax=Strigamia maritima TaxID=126957 RepID=T1IQM6_STRMM